MKWKCDVSTPSKEPNEPQSVSVPATAISLNFAQLKSRVGEQVAVSDWVCVTQRCIDVFAEITGNKQWIHTNPERARRESPYGNTIAHGFLTLSFLSRLMTQVIHITDACMTINYGLNRVRFPAPIVAESKIRAKFNLASLKELPDGYEAVWSVTIESEGMAKPSCIAEWVLRYYTLSKVSSGPSNKQS